MSRLVLSYLEHSLGQLKLTSPYLSTSKLSRKTPCVQCLRCYRPRKPFWLPIAKSKLFKFHIQPVIPKDEEIELSRLYNVYRTNMKSVRQYFKEQLMAQTTAPEVLEERKQREAEQHANSIKENYNWNAEVAKLREERLTKEAAEREEHILLKIVEHEKKQQMLINQIDEHVRQEKIAAKTFITPKNIDEAIESALSKVVDHNFCIDLGGNIFKGRYGKPPPKSNEPVIPRQLTNQETTTSMEVRN